MSLSARKFTHLSSAEYLAAENDGPWRHEFVNGAVFAMPEPGAGHNLVVTRLMATLLEHVPQGCHVFSIDFKLRIKTDLGECFYYPDVFVACSREDREEYWSSSAVLVIEVMSPSTERIDRHEKFANYRQLPSLSEYGLISQDAVELFRRRTDWQCELYQRDDTVTFESVGLTIKVSSLYLDIDFDDPASPHGEGSHE